MNKEEKKFYKEQSDNLKIIYLNCGVNFILREVSKFVKTTLNVKLNGHKMMTKRQRSKVYFALKEMRNIWGDRD